MAAPRADDDYDYLFKGVPPYAAIRQTPRLQRLLAAPCAPHALGALCLTPR